MTLKINFYRINKTGVGCAYNDDSAEHKRGLCGFISLGWTNSEALESLLEFITKYTPQLAAERFTLNYVETPPRIILSNLPPKYSGAISNFDFFTKGVKENFPKIDLIIDKREPCELEKRAEECINGLNLNQYRKI